MTTQTALQQGIKHLALDIAPANIAKLEEYLQLLEKWNRTYNLTAVRDKERMVSHHLLDSLSLVPHLSNCKLLLDVGSGGGMPGIPVAIVRPDIQVTLIDSNHKKTTFLRQVALELSLPNVAIITERVENINPTQKFDCIVSRAFSELAEFVKLTAHLLAADGVWLAMKGVHPYEEIDQLNGLVQVMEVIALNVPGLAAERHLVRMAHQ